MAQSHSYPKTADLALCLWQQQNQQQFLQCATSTWLEKTNQDGHKRPNSHQAGSVATSTITVLLK